MELQDYTTEELRAELKRRAALVQQERLNDHRCRNCKHFMQDPRPMSNSHRCSVRTFVMKNRTYGYCVKPWMTCDNFEKGDKKDFIKELFWGI